MEGKGKVDVALLAQSTNHPRLVELDRLWVVYHARQVERQALWVAGNPSQLLGVSTEPCSQQHHLWQLTSCSERNVMQVPSAS
jgi:hypothetical protein